MRGTVINFVEIERIMYNCCVSCYRWPKLRTGGIMAGHDFMLASEGHTIFTVKPAVQEFARHMNLMLFHTNDNYPTWFVFKP